MVLTLSVIFPLLMAGFSPATAQDQFQAQAQALPHKNYFMEFYQDHISVADGDRCTMVPSCSQYAAQAFKKHGWVMGWIMSCDRLVRCGRDEVNISPSRYINGKPHTLDPVDANDFWWFNKPKTKMDPK